MFRAYKYRIYPTQQQSELLNKHFGACRLVYNLALEVKQEAWAKSRKNLSDYDLHKQLTELKKECEWLKEISYQSLAQSISNLDTAFKSFWRHGKDYPKFKNKHSLQSFQSRQIPRVDFDNGKLFITKFREGIKTIFSQRFEGQIKNVTISKTPTGKYFASILVDNGKELPIKTQPTERTTIGIDVGLKSFIATSSGATVDNPKHVANSLQRLRVLQRRASRKKKGSSNRRKAVHKVALLHERIRNQRTDFLQKLSSKLIRENQTVCVEDLNVSGMVKNRSLARTISDASWSSFIAMLEYKANWYGKNLLKIGRFEASTKTCSDCGATNQTLTLADREWVCATCGTFHDRDFNAAKNIKAFALKKYSGRGTPVEPVEVSAIAESMKQELKNNSDPTTNGI